MFGSKGEEEPTIQADEPMATPVEEAFVAPTNEPVEPVAPATPSAPEAPEVTPQPDMITPEGGDTSVDEMPEEEKSGEGNINLGA